MQQLAIDPALAGSKKLRCRIRTALTPLGFHSRATGSNRIPALIAHARLELPSFVSRLSLVRSFWPTHDMTTTSLELI